MSIAPKKGETFHCEACGREFTALDSEEDVMAEARGLWGDLVADPADCAVICDECFRRGMGS